jgi:coenzyme F420 hydrogenase subunit beta
MYIKMGKFIVILDSGDEIGIPLKEFEAYCSDFCQFCDDSTAEYADISIGSIGSKVGCSTVITRTKIGEELFNGAMQKGFIKSKSLEDDQESVEFLKKIARKKKSQIHLSKV